MSYIDKDATLAAIANKAKEELADANHYFLEGVQLTVDVVEGMPEPKEAENGSMSCPDARKSHDRTTDDCISRQAAIEKLRNNLPYMQAFGADRSIDLINELPSAQPEQQWIPCSERVPFAEFGESDYVLTTCGYRDVKDTSVRWIRLLYFNGGNWCYPTGETYEQKVYAWMPLPEPAKLGGD